MQLILPFDGAPYIVNEGNKHRVKIQVSNPEYNDKSSDSVKETLHRTRTVSTTAEVVEFFKEWLEDMFYEDAYNKVKKWLDEHEAKKKQVKKQVVLFFKFCFEL